MVRVVFNLLLKSGIASLSRGVIKYIFSFIYYIFISEAVILISRFSNGIFFFAILIIIEIIYTV